MARYKSMVDAALTDTGPRPEIGRPSRFEPPRSPTAPNINPPIEFLPPEEPEPYEGKRVPTKIRMLHHYAYWFDDSGQSRLRAWHEDQIVTDADEIADLMARSAPFVEA